MAPQRFVTSLYCLLMQVNMAYITRSCVFSYKIMSSPYDRCVVVLVVMLTTSSSSRVNEVRPIFVVHCRVV